MMLPFGLDAVSFGAGFLAAVLVALLVYGGGWFGKQLGAPMKPMTVIHTTARTPWQVTMGCASAVFLLLMLGMVIAALVVVLVLGAALADVWWMFAVAGIGLLLGLITRAMA